MTINTINSPNPKSKNSHSNDSMSTRPMATDTMSGKPMTDINPSTNPKNMNSSQASSQTPRVFSMIVAAGKGSRFGSDIPKQYTSLQGSTVLQVSVKALSTSPHIKELYLVIAEADTVALSLEYAVPIKFVTGGTERWQSVQLGVKAILDAGAHSDDLILIHDAARPCILSEHIDSVIAAAFNEPYGAILGVPVADTLKQVSEGAVIEKTVDRRNLWQAQTPQVFRAGELYKALRYIDKHNLSITDEASAFELMGYPIKIVRSNHQNVKLTYAEDLTLVESILLSRNSLLK